MRDELKIRLLKVLQGPPRMRTSQLLQAAGVTDRRAGEDAIWALVKEGKVSIGPDSVLRLVD